MHTEKNKPPKGEIWIKLKNAYCIKSIFYENLIVNDFGRFLAQCCKNPAALNSGIDWIELGTGNIAWNISSPPVPTTNDTGLQTPVLRHKRINDLSGGFTYRDVLNPSNISTNPTRIIQIEWLLDYNVGNGLQYMELGMFSNSTLGTEFPLASTFTTATTPSISSIQSDTNRKGIMINKKNFPVFTKTADWQLEITYRITFGE